MSKIFIRLSSALFAIVLLLTAMPFSAIADETVPVVDAVKVTGATINFNAGDTPVFTAESAEPDLYSTRLDTFERWMDVDTGAYITSSEFYNGRIEAWGNTRLTEFEAGHTYAYSLSVQAVDLGVNDFACTFDENASISINGVNYSVPAESKRVEDFDGVNYQIFFGFIFTITIDSPTVAPHTHNYTDKVTKATLTANGKIVPTCSCGETKTATTIYSPKTISLSATVYNYDGKVKTPAVTVKDAKGKTLVKNTDYTVTYASGRKLVGKYAVKISFKGNYSGTKTLYFTIRPKNTTFSLASGKKAITAKIKKYTTQTTGYQIQYATNSKFTSAKTVAMKNTTTSKTISKLAGGKKYYVRVRTYKTVKINGKNTNIYSAWSSAKAVTTKK